MATLLAQATAEWYDGWQLAVATSGVVILLVGWLHRILKADINRIDHKLDDLKDITLKDALERARMQPAQPFVVQQPATSPSPRAQTSDLGFAAPTAQLSEKTETTS